MSGVKKLMHKIKEKMEHVGEGHHQQDQSSMEKDTWPGVGQTGTGTTGAAQGGAPGVGKQTTVPSATHPTSIPGSGAEKMTDASRLVDAPPTGQKYTMAHGSNLSSGTTPKVMTGEYKSGTDALAKSPVYSPLGSAHESVAAAKPDVTDVGTGMGSATVAPGGAGTKGQQAFTGTLPNVGQKEPKLHTTNTDTVSSKTGAGAPNPLTHPKDLDYTPNLTTKPPPTSAFTSGTGSNSKPGSHVDELKDLKAKAGSAVNRSPNLTGDIDMLGAPTEATTTHTYEPKTTGRMPGALEGNTGKSHMDELKDSKAKAGSAVNRSPNLTGDVHELGRPAQEAEGTPKPMMGGVSPAHNPTSRNPASKVGDKDYTSALDKIADDKEAGAAAGAGAGGGLLAAAADYVHSGARSVADTAHGYTNEGDRSLGEDIKTTGQSAVDQVKGATKPYADAAADKTQAAKDSLTSSNQGTTGSKGISGPGSVSGKRVTTPADDTKSYVQQAKEGLAAAAAVTADKASQAYQVVADKAYETGIPQKLGEHANTARDTAAAKYDELTNQAQKHGAAVRDVGADRLATAKAQAQDYAQTAQQRTAEHMNRMRNVSPEDVNRSGLGRMAGGVALLWLASYAIGIPFKYGLAGALLAISALLFAEWDQGNRARRARVRSGTMDTKGGVVDDVPHFGTAGGIDAKTGAAPASSIHESSIGDISSKAKQNFPVDPVSTTIGSGGPASHSSHGAVSYGRSGLGSDSGAGPTVSAGGLGQSAGAKASAPAKPSGPSALESSFYHTTEPVRVPPVGGAAMAQTMRGTATGAGFDSTYQTTEPAHKVEQLQPTAAEKARFATEE